MTGRGVLVDVRWGVSEDAVQVLVFDGLSLYLESLLVERRFL